MTASQPATALADLLAELSDAIKNCHDVVDALDRVVVASTSSTAAVAAGILLTDANGQLHIGASSSERSTEVEEAQLGVNLGPSMHAVQSAKPLEVPDIAATYGLWPEFAQLAEERGFLAAYAIPLRLRNHSLGGMNLFFDRRGSMSDLDMAIALALAQTAALVIVHDAVSDQGLDLQKLQSTLENRIVIEQAKGVLAQQHGIQMDAAFQLLRAHARRELSSLSDVARRVAQNQLLVDSD